VPDGKTLNSEFSAWVLKRLMRAVLGMRPHTILKERQLVPFAQQCLYSSNVTVKCFLAN